MVVEPTFLGIGAGDWLQACATVFAVVGTILGTLYIERRNREAANEEDVDRLVEVVKAVNDAAASIGAGLPQDATNFEHYARSFNMQTALKTAIDMYRFVRADTKVKNLTFWRSLKSLDEALAEHSKTLGTELQLLASDGHHTNVFNINREKVTAAALPIHAAAEEALAAAPN